MLLSLGTESIREAVADQNKADLGMELFFLIKKILMKYLRGKHSLCAIWSVRCDYSENNVDLAKVRLTDCYKKLPIRSRSPLMVADRGCTPHLQELGSYIKANNM